MSEQMNADASRDLAYTALCKAGGADRDAFETALDVYDTHRLADVFDEGVRSWGELIVRRSELENPYRRSVTTEKDD